MAAGEPEINIAELLRKTVYGPNGSFGAYDFNNLFSPGASSSRTNLFSPGTILEMNPGAGVGEAGNATGHANDPGNTPTVGQALSAAFSAFSALSATTPIGIAMSVANAAAAVQGKPSPLSALMSVVANAMDPNGLSIDTNAPETPNANESGLSQAQDSQNAFESMSADSGDAPDTGSAGPDGSGTSAGNAADADGGSGAPGGTPDSGDFAMGGFVPGHDMTGSDTFHANLSGGEFIVPTKIVDMIGRNFFEKLLLTKSPLEEAAEKMAKETQKASA